MNDSQPHSDNGLLTFGGHLEVMRQMMLRILAVSGCAGIIVFCFKEETFNLLLAPSEAGFVTYRWIEDVLASIGVDFRFDEFHINLIATELPSQFMTHLTTSIYLGLLIASPFILYELFRFISPALYDNERRYSLRAIVVIYLLFGIGLLMNYFVLFPISFRFLGTYSVDSRVTSIITLDSYISTLTTLSFLMGLVFQLPVIAYFLGKMGIIYRDTLRIYRRHAFIVIMVVAAIITPPDLMTLVLVTIPLYMLYEASIYVLPHHK